MFDNSKVKVNNCINYYNLLSSSFVEISSIKKPINEAKRRGIALRFITEITKDNINYYKELYKLVKDIRHLDGLKGNFMFSESEYISLICSYNLNEERVKKTIPECFYSNIKSFIEEQQYFFDILWNKAIPVEKKIKEIEGNTPVVKTENPTQQAILDEKEKSIIKNYETRILENQDKIRNRIIHLAETSSQLLIVSSYGGMQLIYSNFLNYYKKILDKYKKGDGKEGIKWICNIEKENLELVKTFLKMGMQIRHIRNLPPLNFALGDREINATIEEMEDGKMVQSLLTSNEPLYVKHFNSIFQNLWYSGIDARDRIKELEQDIESEGIEIIRNPFEVQRVIFDLLRLAQEEILIVFSTANAFHRQEKAGSIKLLTEIASKKDFDIKIKIMTPIDNKLQQIKSEWDNVRVDDDDDDDEIKEDEYKERQIENTLEEKNRKQQQNPKKIKIKFIESQSKTTVSILIVDRKYSLVAELKDDTKDTSFEAIGLATFSNSKSTVLSYVSMFETLWLQTKLSDLLKLQDKIQKEFINVASHELRTPIQPILGLADILYSKIEDKEQRKLLEIIIRNANRLQRLTNDILDVAKIETGTLLIKKERFNLYDLISNLISHYKTSSREIEETKKVNFVYIADEQSLFIEGDKGLLNQVLDNLLSNAIKFTKRLDDDDTIITITTKREESNDNNIIVSIKDNGTGIDKEIMPRLFTKFATKSEAGTGLASLFQKIL